MDLPPDTAWRVESEREAWLLVIGGTARVGLLDAGVGEGIFIQADRVDLQSGPAGLTGLVAYTGSEPLPNLLQRCSEAGSIHAGAPESQIVVLPQADAISTNKGLEIIR